MGDEIHLYIAADSHTAQRAASLDTRNEAGSMFGIPECCQRWFGERWENCRAQGGDLFAEMIRTHHVDGHLQVAQECDASAMFRGGGLCWHFPCGPKCEATIAAIHSRKEALLNLDASLVATLLSAQVQQLWLAENGRYHTRCPDRSRAIAIAFV
jgi:hypothetical protein